MYKFPLRFIGITQKFKDGTHFGVDFGWNNNYGGKNAPIYASADGVVYSVKDNDTTGKSWGNLVKIDHGNNEYTLYGHLKTGAVVKKSQNVKQGDLIGYMGNTGQSNGNHLHFEFYKGGASTKYRVNPLDYVYAFKDQTVTDDSKKLVKFYEQKEVTKVVERDKYKNQIEVLIKNLRIRENHNTESEIIGLSTQNGIYNYYETAEEENYIWYRIAENQWIAQNKEETYLKIYEKEDTTEILALKARIEELEQNNIKLQEQLKNATTGFKIEYKAMLDGMYKIKLKTGEILQIK